MELCSTYLACKFPFVNTTIIFLDTVLIKPFLQNYIQIWIARPSSFFLELKFLDFVRVICSSNPS
jgi:hypothetical protein